MAIIPQSSVENRLLASLSKADFAELMPKLQSGGSRVHDVLYKPMQEISFAYFPTAIFALSLLRIRPASAAKLASWARKVLSGIAMVLFSGSTRSEVVVQVEGRAVRIQKKVLQSAMTKSPALSATLLRFAHVFSVQTSQTAVTNANDTIPQRLARWILCVLIGSMCSRLYHDPRVPCCNARVRRSGVTEASE